MALEAVKQDSSTPLRPLVSIVIPLLNEADNVGALYQCLRAAMKQTGWSWEVIFVDDGSPMPPLSCCESCISRTTTCAF
jgi:cellulose synthase/poly-beta-1,6-N-acetylglucosamine synthase-like glycosyltransferase